MKHYDKYDPDFHRILLDIYKQMDITFDQAVTYRRTWKGEWKDWRPKGTDMLLVAKEVGCSVRNVKDAMPAWLRTRGLTESK